MLALSNGQRCTFCARQGSKAWLLQHWATFGCILLANSPGNIGEKTLNATLGRHRKPSDCLLNRFSDQTLLSIYETSSCRVLGRDDSTTTCWFGASYFCYNFSHSSSGIAFSYLLLLSLIHLIGLFNYVTGGELHAFARPREAIGRSIPGCHTSIACV